MHSRNRSPGRKDPRNSDAPNGIYKENHQLLFCHTAGNRRGTGADAMIDVFQTSEQFTHELDKLANDSLVGVTRLLQAELGDSGGNMTHALIDIYSCHVGFVRTYLRFLNEHVIALMKLEASK